MKKPYSKPLSTEHLIIRRRPDNPDRKRGRERERRSSSSCGRAAVRRMDTTHGAALWLIEFGDYECPFCRRSHPALQNLIAANPGLTVGYRHYPLNDIHPVADAAARAAICAEFQGRFPEIHSLLLTTTDWADAKDWARLAERVGISDLAEFRRCLTSEAVVQRLEEDRALAEALGVTGTPTFFYRYGSRRGYLDEVQLTELLESTRRKGGE